ncbi:MAG: SDR family oxidoreductase [Candidatus Hodarchaeales archaeon]
MTNQKIVLITGATSGIGQQTAFLLAEQGYELVLASRKKIKNKEVIDQIRTSYGTKSVHYIPLDLANLVSVNKFLETFQEQFSTLNVLINNAGIVLANRELTEQGYEKIFTTNYLGPFVLTLGLLDILKNSSLAKIINVTSEEHTSGKIKFDNLMGEQQFKGWQAYANSKLANVLFTYKLARKMKQSCVKINCIHPGIVKTNFGKEIWWINIVNNLFGFFIRGPKSAAKTIVNVLDNKNYENTSGVFFDRYKIKKSAPISYNHELQDRLWEKSLELTKEYINLE